MVGATIPQRGYLTSFTETDPKVGQNTPGYLSKWSGVALVSGSIFDDGKIGIGTMNPGRQLSVIGTVRSANDVDEIQYTEFGHGGANGFVNTVGDGNLEFRHDDSTKMLLTSEGRLRVGMGPPSSQLDVDGDVEIGSSDAFYLGGPDTDGSWRFTVSADDISIERRESGSWVAKARINP